MNLLEIFRHYQKKFILNEIIYLVLIALSLIGFLVLLVAGLFLPRIILWTFVPLMILIVYYEKPYRSILSLAKVVEDKFPEFKNEIVPVVELAGKIKELEHREQYSLSLIIAAANRITKRIESASLKRIIDTKKTYIAGTGLLIISAILIFLKFLAPQEFTFGGKLLFLSPRRLIAISIEPGDLIVNRDTSINIKYGLKSPTNKVFGELIINGQRIARSRVSDSLTLSIREETDYYVVAKSFLGVELARTPVYRIRLWEPVRIKELVFTAYPPQYTKLPPKQVLSKEIRALLGSKIEVRGQTFQPLVSGELITHDNHYGLSVKGNEFWGNFIARQTDSVKVLLTGDKGNSSSSDWYYLLLEFDQPPFIRLFLPGRDIDLPVNMELFLGVHAFDDFGISRLELHYTKPTSPDTVKIKLKDNINRSEDTIFYRWDLKKLNLLPGEIINYYCVAYDNNTVNGPGIVQSEIYSIRFPSLSEIYEQASKTNISTTNQLRPIFEEQQKLVEELDNLTEQLQKYRTLGWEERAKLSELVSKQEQLVSQIKELEKRIEEIVSDLYSGLLLDQETIERINEISEVLNRILPEEIKKHLDDLKQSLSEKNLEFAQSLKNLKLSSQEMKEMLRKTLELLKNLQKENALRNLARKAEELYNQEKQLRTQMTENNLSSLVQPQMRISEEIDTLEQEIQRLSLEFTDKAIKEELEAIASDLSNKALAQKATQVGSALSQNKCQEAQALSQNLIEDLEELKDRLNRLAENYKADQTAWLISKLLDIIYQLNRISEIQEELLPTSQNYLKSADRAMLQKQLAEATTAIAETLAKLSEKSVFVSPKWLQTLSKVIVNMDGTAKLIAETPNSLIINNNQEEIVHHLNLVTFQILNQVKFLKEKTGGSKGNLENLLEALSQLTADQMALNQGTSGIPIPVPGGLSSEQLAQLQQLMTLQSQLRSQLARLIEEINMGEYGELPGMTGSLEGALEEMKAIEKSFEELNINRKTIERQEKVIEHLLDAQRSIRQKASEDKRERTVGKEFFERELFRLDRNLGENKKQLREEIMRALRSQYPKEYEYIIRNYFEELMKE
jgi:hypothetical protein